LAIAVDGSGATDFALEESVVRGTAIAASVGRATPRFGVPPKYLLNAAIESNAALSLADTPSGSVGSTTCSTHS
jgi:hypothetical protein